MHRTRQPRTESTTHAGRSALLALLLSLTLPAAHSQEPADYFLYDAADEAVAADVRSDPELYDAHVAVDGDSAWLAWLQFMPGSGDRLWIGRRSATGQWSYETCVETTPRPRANPRVVPDGHGRLWVSWEESSDGGWDVLCGRIDIRSGARLRLTGRRRVSMSTGPDIRHRSVAAPNGDLWIAWQSDRDGQFDVVARRLGAAGAASDASPFVVSAASPSGDWHPDVAVTATGDLLVVWDRFSGTCYDVWLRSQRAGKWREPVAIAKTPAFEGRASVAAGSDGRVWIAWEEGGANWGRRYVPAMYRDSNAQLDIADDRGPLHRFRRLRIASVDAHAESPAVLPLASPLPAPSLDLAAKRADKPRGVDLLGAFYERARLAVDARGRLWVAYRHFYVPGLGTSNRTHQEKGWGVFARCLDMAETDAGKAGWSRLYRFDVGQGDGMQSLAIASVGEGMIAAWTAGRTDRDTNQRPRGFAIATIAAPSPPSAPATVDAVSSAPPPSAPAASVGEDAVSHAKPQPATVAGTEYELVFGDLHRHTDLSLCRVPSDGTFDDTYRYAIDVGRLDFLAITDHSRDIARGNPLSQLWWRSVKEVDRHDLGASFIPFYGYERSRGAEDHNVISLRADRLRRHTYPHARFWRSLRDETLTIPHQTATPIVIDGEPPPLGLDPKTWEVRDDAHRPLLEIYQGCRDRSIERDAHEGLSRGNLLGFIASSDHQSTAASWACVWTTDRSRAAVFRAMKARRTFGATARIRLVVTAGEHWMGEVIRLPRFPRVDIEVDGTAPIRAVGVTVDGKVVANLPADGKSARLSFTPKDLAAGRHWLYVLVLQEDGNRAWSSPIWVDTE